MNGRISLYDLDKYANIKYLLRIPFYTSPQYLCFIALDVMDIDVDLHGIDVDLGGSITQKKGKSSGNN